MTHIKRRDLLKQTGGAIVATAAASAVTGLDSVLAAEPQGPAAAAGTSPFFPGFAVSRVKTSGAEIHVVKGGQGSPLLLLHGAPQTHITWRLVAPQLKKNYTLVIPDLRGYGDS